MDEFGRGNIDGLRSWRRPLPSGAVRRQSTSRPKVKCFQSLKELSFQYLHKFILDNTKIIYSYNCLIFLLFLQAIEMKMFFISYWNPIGCGENKIVKTLDTNLHGLLQCHAMPTNDVVGRGRATESGRRRDRGRSTCARYRVSESRVE